MASFGLPIPMTPGHSVGVVHVHSDYSRDGKDPLARLRDFALARGIAFVALTDHAEDFAPELFDEYREECASLSDDRVRLIPGLEFRFARYRGLHLLAMGLERWIEPATPEAFAVEAADAARFTAMAHPVLAHYLLPDAVAARIDAIEVWNASYNTRYLPDPRAIALLHRVRVTRPEVVGIAGLDQHDASNDRGTRVTVRGDAGDPLAELKAGHFHNSGRTMEFDAAVTLTAGRRAALALARGALDVVNGVHEHAVRVLRASARAHR